MKKFVLCSLLTVCLSLLAVCAHADEGMWLLPYLKTLNAKDMKAKGLKLKVEEIYSETGTSLKDAIVIFGGGCTGEVVSPDGLLLTNHHCGYNAIQNISTVEADYLKNGFWALSRGEEIPAPGLSVTFIRAIEEVTDEVLGEAAELGSGPQRDAAVKAGMTRASERMQAKYPDCEITVQTFMGGNQYFAAAGEIYTDIRLVGTPPSAMGKFGGETDNWMWPRHTDDFSMWRIYAGTDNKPADYSPENRPYAAPVHLKISLGGIKEGDFAMIMGFPGSTQRYQTTAQMERMMEIENANRIYIRGERQAILMEDMLADDAVRLKYAAKYASSSNYWKNSIGMNKALKDNRIPERQAELEARFQHWADGHKDSPQQYHLALERIREAIDAISRPAGIAQYLNEALGMGVELVPVPQRVGAVMRVEDGRVTNIDEVMDAMAKFYRDYNEPTDRRAAKRMFTIVRENLPEETLPTVYQNIAADFGGDIPAFVDWLYDGSVYTSPERLRAALENYDGAALDSDPAQVVLNSVRGTLMRQSMQAQQHAKAIDDWHRVYIRGLGEMNPDAKYYPDANFSMRLSYGSVLPYEPKDGVIYKYYTTLKGVIEKEDPSKPLEFTVPAKLKEAYYAGDYGRYGEDGELRLNFLTNNDITGGNSGSPVMNARGELIGLAFDGNWEAMSGDILFEPRLQRCINVDIRYVLWTIDRFAGASYILNEMTIVQ